MSVSEQITTMQLSTESSTAINREGTSIPLTPELSRPLRRRHPRRRPGVGWSKHATLQYEKKGGEPKKTGRSIEGKLAEEGEETEFLYECCACTMEYPLTEGVTTCAEHFLCTDCLILAFTITAREQGLDIFPAKCCGKAVGSRRVAGLLRRRLAEHLLSPEVNEAYKRKEEEFYEAPAVKVYCMNCTKWLPSKEHYNEGPYSLASCDCGTIMCVGCKGAWKEGHRCTDPNVPNGRPDWLPMYTSSFRVKKCPACHMYIEHGSACNHMTCKYCHHQFCFVCMLPWDVQEGFDDVHGCPSYQDPAVGYDDEGYENNERGLHRDTGLNREGLNRKGQQSSAEQAQNFGDAEGDYDDDQYFDDDQYSDDGHSDHVDYDHDDYQSYHGYQYEETGPIVHIDPEEMAEQEYRRELDATVPLAGYYYDRDETSSNETTPEEAHSLTWDRIECRHVWQPRYSEERCSVCSYYMPVFHYQCTVCSLTVCRSCAGAFMYSVEYFDQQSNSMVNIIQFAEKGEVPFRTRQKEYWRGLQEADAVPIWSVSLMFQQYEKQLYQAQPFLYFGYGIAEMFDQLEKEAREGDWYVVEHDVGFPGNAMTFRLDTNPFAPLFWEAE